MNNIFLVLREYLYFLVLENSGYLFKFGLFIFSIFDLVFEKF